MKPPPPPLTPPPPPTPRTPPRPGKLPQFLFLLLLRPKAAYRETGSKKYPLRETQGKVARTRHLSSLFRPSSPRPSPSHRLICPGDQVKGKGEEEEEEEEVSLLISYLYVDAKPVLKHAGKQASYSPLSSLVPPAVVHINHCPPPPLSSLIPRAEPGLCEGGGRRRQRCQHLPPSLMKAALPTCLGHFLISNLPKHFISPPHTKSEISRTRNTKEKKLDTERRWTSHLGDRVLHDQYVRDGSKLAEVLPQLLRGGLPGEAAHEELAGGAVGGGGAAARAGGAVLRKRNGKGCGEYPVKTMLLSNIYLTRRLSVVVVVAAAAARIGAAASSSTSSAAAAPSAASTACGDDAVGANAVHVHPGKKTRDRWNVISLS